MKKKLRGVSVSLLVGIVGITLALIVVIVLILSIESKENKRVIETDRVVDGGKIAMTYTDDSSELIINNMQGLSDSAGIILNSSDMYFDFSVNCNLKNNAHANYEIAVTRDNNASNISDKDIRIYLEKQVDGMYVGVFGPESYDALKEDTKFGSPQGSMVVYTAKNLSDDTSNYRLRFWLSDTAEVQEGALYNYGLFGNVYGKAS